VVGLNAEHLLGHPAGTGDVNVVGYILPIGYVAEWKFAAPQQRQQTA
jgi:hypothetical protein